MQQKVPEIVVDTRGLAKVFVQVFFMLGVSLFAIHIPGCTSGAEGEGDAWSLGERDGDESADDTGSNGDDSADDPGSDGDGGHGDIVCGEPGQVITTIEAASELAPCDVYRGSFEFNLNGTDYTNLEALPSLRVIEGTLKIESGLELRTVEGLESLERVGKLILIRFREIEDWSGLSSLRRVEGLCEFKWMRITDFQGLENLRSTGDLKITGMWSLRSFAGLDGLQRVRGDFFLYTAGEMPQSELDSFLERVQIDGEVNATIE